LKLVSDNEQLHPEIHEANAGIILTLTLCYIDDFNSGLSRLIFAIFVISILLSC